ncbi:hypothetical protein [uncultured Cohaesibacter sp.]|uniref:hypothetical protein n=1 Tax=uncultured Cohaesibacter sp. TaxID=1002546 RepID=UPI0029309A14|nr:hypothetical protein [uncultured Cohaesibacter sp.]
MAKSDAHMSIERFEEMLDSYGPDLKSWPQDLQGPALALLESSELARKKMQFDASMAKLIRASKAPKAPSSLVGSIMDKIKKQ